MASAFPQGFGVAMPFGDLPDFTRQSGTDIIFNYIGIIYRDIGIITIKDDLILCI